MVMAHKAKVIHHSKTFMVSKEECLEVMIRRCRRPAEACLLVEEDRKDLQPPMEPGLALVRIEAILLLLDQGPVGEVVDQRHLIVQQALTPGVSYDAILEGYEMLIPSQTKL